MRAQSPLFAILIATLLIAAVTAPLGAHARRQKNPTLVDQAVNEALVSPPGDLEACFSPDEPCGIKLVKFVRSARSSIDIAIYDINLDSLVREILAKSKSIPTRLVVDRRQAQGDRSAVPLLIKSGVNLRYGRQRGIMHNKFVLVDGKAVETGSFNETFHASTANSENQLYLQNPQVVERYRKRFEKLWAEADATP